MSRYNPVGITCPQHGYQYGRTRCRCGFDPLFPKINRQDATPPGPDVLGRADDSVSPLSFDLVHDQFQDVGDSVP